MPPHDKNMESEATEDPFGLGCALEMFVEHEEVFGLIENLKNIYTDSSATERAYERFHLVILQYKEQPHLLDPHLSPILDKCVTIIRGEQNAMDLKHWVFKYMFVIVNVRGYKVIVRHLPHEVADFEPVLKLLEAQDPTDSANWQTRYILLLWLSIIVMIPFHLSRFDGSDSSEKTVMCRVLDVIQTYVVVFDKCRDSAAYLSARFITRNDVKQQHLSDYFDWAISLSLSPDSNVFIKYGTLSSVATILKLGKREDLLPHARRLLQWIVNEEIKTNVGCNVQKLVYKIVQRIGLTFLPPRVALWRYKRGNRSLALNLCGGDGGTATATNSSAQEAIDTSEDIEVPDEVEEVIDQLIQGLRAEDGIVRWSAAKGVGRVTGRLPQELADEVVGSVLELFSPREGDGAWHGACLALAELGRRGLLLPKRLPEVVPFVLKALVYDEPRGYSSVGSHIRDAACYVCWSFARAYETAVLKPFVNDIAATLLVVVCFDREINCRRAASAAFQENVGRQGTFPHGIDILTTADFFAVSVRHNAYLTISVYIAQFEEYTLPLIDHLVSRKVDHWDCVIRELCAKALHNLTPKAPDYMVESVIPTLFKKANSIDLNSRHGAVLAIGEISLSLSKIDPGKSRKIGDTIGEDLVRNVKNLIPNYRKNFFFRGLGGELMRQACCDFIEKTCLSTLDVKDNSVAEDWLNLLNECIAYNVPNIQLGAIKALPVLLEQHFSSSDDGRNVSKQNDLVRKYIHELLATTQQEVRMGHALALGALPRFVLKDHLETVIESLIESIKITPLSQKWAESRRDAVEGLTTLATTMAADIGTVFTVEQVLKIYEVFLEGLRDYTQDKRGDVGAWVREASMSGLQTLTFKVVAEKPELLTADFVTRIIGGVAQQAVEKIDRTRAIAGKVFYSFLYNEIAIPNIPNYEDLIEIFRKEDCEDLNWNSSSDTFPKFVELLQFPAYSYTLMVGLICSVGGLTETLVKNSSSSLFAYLKKEEKLKGLDEIQRLCEIIHQIFTDFQKNDRITIPTFRFLEKLFASGCISLVIDNPESDFAKRILKLILVEINGCKDLYKLIDGINILAQFIQIKNETCPSALVQLSILLCHRQSYVRRSTSTVLYESLLVYGDTANINTDHLDEVMQILGSTNWEEPVEEVKPIRNQLCSLMGIRVPVPKNKA